MPKSQFSPDVKRRLGSLLAHFERKVVAIKAEVVTAYAFSTWDDSPVDTNRLILPILNVIVSARKELAIGPQSISRQQLLAGSLSVLWSDLMEIEPERLKQQWGLVDIPETWSDLHCRMIAAVELALKEVERTPPDR